MNNIESITTGLLYGNSSQAQELVNSKAIGEDQKIATSCKLFEATLFRQILGESMKPMIGGYLGESNSNSDIYRSFVTDTLASKMSESGSLGIANLLQAQLQHKVSHHEPENE